MSATSSASACSQQAAPCGSPGATSPCTANIGGTSAAQRAIARGQRSRNAQPVPSSQIDGTTPAISARSPRAPSP
jgi:hypothetical protein